jgi:hypothetical protein
MAVLPRNVATITIRQGGSYARGTTIDEYLTQEDCAVLYEKWQADWPEPFQFHGGITAINCEMVLEVPEKELNHVFGKKRTARILEIAHNNAGR